MITHDDDGGILVKGLRLNPLHKFSHLSAGTGYGLVIAFAADAFFTKLALIAAHMVGVYGQHGKGEGFVLL